MAPCSSCEMACAPPPHLVATYGPVFVVLDRESLAVGHSLIIPRAHRPTVYDLPRPDHDALFAAARSLAPRLAAATQSGDRLRGVRHRTTPCPPVPRAGDRQQRPD